MEKAAYIAGVICVTAFITGLLYEIGKFEKTSKVLKFITAVYISVTIVRSFSAYSVTDLKIDLSEKMPRQNYAEEFEKIITEQTQSNLENVIKDRLKEKNISYNQVTVHILEQNGRLSADEIIVKCEKNSIDAVTECIADIADEDTKIDIGE